MTTRDLAIACLAAVLYSVYASAAMLRQAATVVYKPVTKRRRKVR